MKRWITFGLVAMCAGSVLAQNLDQGTHELQLSGDIDFNTGVGESFNVDAGYGYFIADNIEIGGAVGFEDNDAYTSWSAGGFAELNIPVENLAVVPFVGGGAGMAHIDPDEGGSEDAFEVIGYGGAKYFITEDLAIAAQLRVLWATEDIYLDEDGPEESDWDITFGLRYYFDTAGSSDAG